MTQLVFTAAGYALGAAVGFPGLGTWIGSYVGALAAAPDVQGPRLQDAQQQLSSYGAAIPRVWGGDRLAGNVVWAGPLREVASESGGKGGPTITTYSYYRSFAVLLCDGPVASLRRIWALGNLVYDATSADPASLAATGAFAQYVTFYLGDESQLPDATIEAAEGAGNVEAMRGSCYVVFTDLPVTDYGGNIPQLSFEVSTEAPVSAIATTAYEPLVVYDWQVVAAFAGRPVHPVLDASGAASDAQDFVSITQAGSSGSAFGTVATAQAAAFAADAGNYQGGNSAGATSYAGFYYTSTNASFSGGAAGAALVDDPQHVYPMTAIWPKDVGPRAETDIYNQDQPRGTHVLLQPLLPGGVWATWRIIWGLQHGGSGAPPAGYALVPYCQTSLGGGQLLTFWAQYALTLRGLRTPSHDARSAYPGDPGGTVATYYSAARSGWRAAMPSAPDWCIGRDGSVTPNYTWSVTAGTAKQLCAIEYRAGVLYQNALGPLLLPGDAHYSDSAWWAARAADAIAAGTMSADVSTPVVVSSYATGTVPAAYTVPAGSALLADIVADICAEAGLSGAQIDVSALTDIVPGYTRTRRMPARSAIEPLRSAYAFDPVESGGLVKFVKRGGSIAATIGADDMAAGSEQALPALMDSTRDQEAEMPQAVAVSYKSRASDYQPATQEARRRAGGSEQAATVELPMVLDDQTAADIAARLLYDAWAGRCTRKVATWRRWAALEPTDVITLDDGAFQIRARVTDRSEQGGVIMLTCRDDDPDVLAPDAVATTPAGGGAVTVLVGPTRVELLDLPPLRDDDDDLGLYVAACGTTAAWPGGALYRSRDGGTSYQQALTLSQQAACGTCDDALAAWSGGNIVDECSTVTVTLTGSSSTLASCTWDALLAAGNAAVIGGEIVQYRGAELLSAGRYRLSGLLRGRRGTEAAMATHAAGERFVALSSSDLARTPLDLSDLGRALLWKGATRGEPLAAVGALPETPAGSSLLPLAPAHLYVTALPAAAGYSVRWVRRTRIGPAWADGGDVPLGEAGESYRVRVIWGQVVEEEQTVSTTTATVGIGLTLTYRTIEVRQISATVGPGAAATVVVP